MTIVHDNLITAQKRIAWIYAPCSTRDSHSGASGSWVDLGLILVRVSCVRTHTDTLSHAHTPMTFTRVRPAPSGGFEPYIWDACKVRLCDTCARVRPCVP